MTTKRAIDELERFPLGGTDQWVLIRATIPTNPVLLLIGQGPGLPLINEADDLERRLHLENDFIVVYWDQRGCGKSFNRLIDPDTMTLDQMVSDTNELISALTRRFRTEQIYVAGFSIGGTIGALAAKRDPKKVRALITVGMDVRFDDSERAAYAFVEQEARRRGHARATRDLLRIGPPPHSDRKRFGTRVRWLADFGGVDRNETYRSLTLRTLRQLVSSRAYSLADIVRTLRGMRFAQDALLPDLEGFDLFAPVPEIDVPIFMLQGRHDHAAPPAVAAAYAEELIASSGKELVWFEESAHMPHYEEPAKFAATIRRVTSSRRQAIAAVSIGADDPTQEVGSAEPVVAVPARP